MDEGQSGVFRHGAQVLVVGNHDGDLRTEAAGPPAEDQVVEAVAELGDHDQQALGPAVVDGEIHAELGGGGRELGREAFRGLLTLVEFVALEIPMGPITACSAADESGAQVQLPADVVIELLVLHDVEAAVGERGDCPDDAGPFGAGQVRTNSAVRILAKGAPRWPRL